MELTRFIEKKVEEYRQFQSFWPFYKARLQPQDGTLPEFKVDFSPIGTEKPPTEDKEFFQFFVHFKEEDHLNKNHGRIMALGTQLMDKLLVWKLNHANKKWMDVVITTPAGKHLVEIVDIRLDQLEGRRHYKVNQACIDFLANGVISAWDSETTDFEVHITIHNSCG